MEANEHESEYLVSEKKFETIFNESSLGNKVINSDLRIIKVNKALLDILGYSKEELLGALITDFSHPDFREEWLKLRDELWAEKRPSFSIDTCIIRKDKSTLWCHVTSIVFEDSGNTFGYTIIEDISERKRLEQVADDLREKELLIAQQQGRHRIATALHESLAQLLFATKIKLNQINLGHDEGDQTNRDLLRQTDELFSLCIKECRAISYELISYVK